MKRVQIIIKNIIKRLKIKQKLNFKCKIINKLKNYYKKLNKKP